MDKKNVVYTYNMFINLTHSTAWMKLENTMLNEISIINHKMTNSMILWYLGVVKFRETKQNSGCQEMGGERK